MKKHLTLILIVMLCYGCSKKQSDSLPNTVIVVPEKVSLLLPAANAACTTGTVISNTQSTITFNWTAATSADSYDIVIKNLLTSVTTQQSITTNQAQVTLDRNTPYSWYVVSKSTKTTVTTQSDASKFYNAGLGTVNYAPFPAEVVSPVYGSSVAAGNINLVWKGSSVDNNIIGYDIYLGVSATPPLLKSNVTDMFLNAVTVIAGTQYYWRIVTRDALGNTSSSDVSTFKTN